MWKTKWWVCSYSTLGVKGTPVKQSCSKTWEDPQRLSPNVNIRPHFSNQLEPPTFPNKSPREWHWRRRRSQAWPWMSLDWWEAWEFMLGDSIDNIYTLLILSPIYKDQECRRAPWFPGKALKNHFMGALNNWKKQERLLCYNSDLTSRCLWLWSIALFLPWSCLKPMFIAVDKTKQVLLLDSWIIP